MALHMDSSSFDIFTYPPLTDADYMILSSKNASRRPSWKSSKSPMTRSPPLLSFAEYGESREDRLSMDEQARLGPTLHANLVSEILSLRREVESKNELVVGLEEQLLKMKDENASLKQVVSTNAKEKKSLRRQMDDLENGTLAAIEEMARETDRIADTLADTKAKLEVSNKKARSHETEAERVQTLWQEDQEKWQTERTTLERKVHVVESRLKTVLAEVAAAETAVHQTHNHDDAESLTGDRPATSLSGRRSAASLHRDSNGVLNAAVLENKTLAEELDSRSVSDVESEDCISEGALPEEADLYTRSYSSQSNRQSVKARKLLGLHVDAAEEKRTPRDVLLTGYAFVLAEDRPSRLNTLYSNNGTQYSPPPSPQLTAKPRLSTITEFDGDSMLDDTKRKSLAIVMVSSACQTIDVPLSPPATPARSRSVSSEAPKVESADALTQTIETPDAAVAMVLERDDEEVNPDYSVSKIEQSVTDASIQASEAFGMTSTAMQTESIRTDERLTRLPPHLHPQIIRPISVSSSPMVPSSIPSPVFHTHTDNGSEVTPPTSPHSAAQSEEKRDGAVRSRLYQPREQSGLLFSDDELSDDSFLNKKMVKKSLSKVQDSWKLVSQPDIDDTPAQNAPGVPALEVDQYSLDQADAQASPLQQKSKQSSGKQVAGFDAEQTNRKHRSRKSASISRARSPSMPTRPTSTTWSSDLTSGIPYAIPDRSSSRKFLSVQDDMHDNATRMSSLRSGDSQPSTSQRPAPRRSRSYVASQRSASFRRSLSPQAFDMFTNTLNNIPPLPENSFRSPVSTSLVRESRPSRSTPQPAAPAAESAHSDQASVVDAIAQTMIGEWMYKYVRRRKSFGIPEEAGPGESNLNGNLRHQRWVWIAPYEKAIMWSNKQPTSETALLGKNGRKLVITAVLEVRDDLSRQKSALEVNHINRSILVVTPQRALKFTATTMDRHHVWMTALSYLTQQANDLSGIPQRHRSQASTKKAAWLSGQPLADLSLSSTQTAHPAHPSRARKGFGLRGRAASASYAGNPPIDEEQLPVILEGAEAPVVPRSSTDIIVRLNAMSQGQPSPISSRRYLGRVSSNPRSSRGYRGGIYGVGSQRSAFRFWNSKAPRISIDRYSAKNTYRVAPSYATQAEQERHREPNGTMRMSAFVQDTSETYISNQKTSKPKRSFLSDIRSASLTSLESTRASSRRRSERSISRRRRDRKISEADFDENDDIPALPDIPAKFSGKDPFEGF